MLRALSLAPDAFRRLHWAFVTLVTLLAVGACSDDANFAERASGALQVTPYTVTFPQTRLGESNEQLMAVVNLADEPLTIYDIVLEGREGGTVADIEMLDLGPRPLVIEGKGQTLFRLRYTASARGANRGVLKFQSSDARYTRNNPLTVSVDTLENRAQLSTEPGQVRFARLPVGQRASQILAVRNVGTAPLTIFEAPGYSGGEDFRVSLPEGVAYPVELDVFDPEKAALNPERYQLDVEVRYAPTGSNADTGEISLVTSDASQPHPTAPGRGLSIVSVRANADAPCIMVDRRTRNFNQVPIGGQARDVVTVTNCGSEELVLTQVALTANSATGAFEMDLGNWDADGDGQLDNPRRIAARESTTFQIVYTPVEEVTDRGQITLFSNDLAQPELVLDLVGRGSLGQCPNAVAGASIRGVSATPRTSLSAVPLQYVILDGGQSNDPDGQVREYNWEVVSRPQGTIVQLGPTREDRDNQDPSRREFRLLTAGRYELALTVTDDQGFASCNRALVTITAIPNERLHIELTWTNPEDPDESDAVGSDLDMHFVKMGPGRWFEAPYDIYFRNPNRGNDNVAGPWNPENPSLDIDDTSGAGPENITMDNPQACQWYAIGAHYYQEMFGTAYATIRIYVNGELRFEELHKPMTRGGQFWDVARIHWDGTQATIVDSGRILPAIPAGGAPEVTPEMRAEAQGQGLCTAAGLY